MDNNLCLFCGKAGHIAKECPKSSSNAAKGHAIQTIIKTGAGEVESEN